MGNSEAQQGEPPALHGDSHRDTHPCPGTAIPTAASAATDEARGRFGQHRQQSRSRAGARRRLQPWRTFAFYGDLLLHCWHGGDALSSTDAAKGEQKHPRKAQGRQQNSTAPRPTTGKDLPLSQQRGEDPSPGPQLHPPAARILPAWELRPGRGLHHPTPFPQENTQDHRKSHSSLWVYIFFFWLHFIYYPVSHSHRISNYRTYSQIF